MNDPREPLADIDSAVDDLLDELVELETREALIARHRIALVGRLVRAIDRQEAARGGGGLRSMGWSHDVVVRRTAIAERRAEGVTQRFVSAERAYAIHSRVTRIADGLNDGAERASLYDGAGDHHGRAGRLMHRPRGPTARSTDDGRLHGALRVDLCGASMETPAVLRPHIHVVV